MKGNWKNEQPNEHKGNEIPAEQKDEKSAENIYAVKRFLRIKTYKMLYKIICLL